MNMTFKTNVALARSKMEKEEMQLSVHHEWKGKYKKYSLNISRIVGMMCLVKGEDWSTVHPTAIRQKIRMAQFDELTWLNFNVVEVIFFLQCLGYKSVSCLFVSVPLMLGIFFRPNFTDDFWLPNEVELLTLKWVLDLLQGSFTRWL